MLNNMMIKTRLMLLVGLLLVLMLVSSLLGMYTANHSSEAFGSLHDDRMIPVGQLSEISRLNLLNRLAVAHTVSIPESATEHLGEI